jgi:hypothetical protein
VFASSCDLGLSFVGVAAAAPAFWAIAGAAKRPESAATKATARVRVLTDRLLPWFLVA